MFSLPFSPVRLLLIQLAILALAYAFPTSSSSDTTSSYLIVPADQSVRSKRALDRLEGADFGFWSKRALFKRALDRLEGTDFGFRRKRAFDRLARSDFGLRRKRSFDRISGTSFGLTKRSVEDQRDDLVDELAASIVALRRARDAEATPSEPLVIMDAN